MTPEGARTVFGLPLYNPGEHLLEAIESLLAQTRRDFAVVVVDDASSDASPAVVERYAAFDQRLVYVQNEERLGLTRNWKRAFEAALSMAPDAEFFAWASDHDVWHPRWLESLVRELERHAEAMMAYPNHAVIEDGRVLRLRPPSMDTSAGDELARTLWRTARHMRAGQMIYGLFRVEAVRRAGGFRNVLYADRLLLTEVALQGALRRTSEVLWYKRPTETFSIDRQRLACFPAGVPLHARVPWWVVHAGVMLRSSSPRAAVMYLLFNAVVAVDGRRRRLVKRLRRRWPGMRSAGRARRGGA